MEARDLLGLESLRDLNLRNGVDMRPTLLRVLTDLYVHRLGHTADEERHYTELALRLLEAVDVPTRAAVARRFAGYPSPPLQVLQQLARDLPEVAAELHAHPLLQPPAAVNASEFQLPDGPLDAPDQAVWFTDASAMLDLATASELNERFFAADADERRLILLNLHIAAPIAPDRVRVSRGPEFEQRLEQAALARHHEDFARQLAHALHIPSEQARRIARDDLGEPVAVAGKVLGVRRDVLYRILMFVNPAVGHSVERVHALAALYEEMTQPAAESIVAIWQALRPGERAGAKHRPLTYDDETRRRVRPAAPEQRTLERIPVRPNRDAL